VAEQIDDQSPWISMRRCTAERSRVLDADDRPSRLSAALACQAWVERGGLHWSCDGEAAIRAINREARRL
jgi:hypothetical protein